MIWISNLGEANDKAIPIICGPTGSGKSGIALELAAQYPVEVVSADSCQIIKYLDIGTAKPTVREREIVPTHLIDIIEPGEKYSAYRFLAEAEAAIADIKKRDRIPLIVGGSGLYLKILTEGAVEIEGDSAPAIRHRLEADMEKLGPEEMHRRLAEIDPAEADAVHPNNRVRVIRALEIFESTGQSKSDLVKSGAYKKSNYVYDFYCLMPPREKLYRAIEFRVDAMILAGLPAELEGLVKRGLGERIREANVIGYSEFLEYMDGHCTFDEAVASIKRNTRRYAKRQITWFRHQITGRFFADAKSLRQALPLS